MYIDTTIRSKGHIVVKATTLGSYGEAAHRQFGPSYKTVDSALKQVQKLHDAGMKGIEMYNQNTKAVHYF